MKQIASETEDNETIALFTSETFSGINLESNELFEFSNAVGGLYISLINSYANKFAHKFKIPSVAAAIILRRTLVPLCHFFSERFLRVANAFANYPEIERAPHKSEFSTCQSIEEFEYLVSHDRRFNDTMIAKFGEFFGARSEMREFEEAKTLTDSKVKNHLFVTNASPLFIKILRRLTEKFLTHFRFFHKFPVLTFANAEPIFQRKGYYIFAFDRINDSISESALLQPNEQMRTSLLSLDNTAYRACTDFFSRISKDSTKSTLAVDLFQRYLIQFFPIQCLENFELHFAEVSNTLRRTDSRAILSSGDSQTGSAFFLAAAKALNMTIIKAQHGGHYGYLRDVSPVIEVELPSADIFLTWGWERMHASPALEHIETVVMPSPWLSERRLYWQANLKLFKGHFDILWMPQMMKRFTGAPQGASSIRRDVIQQFSANMLEFVKTLTTARISILVKPYNQTTLSLMTNTYTQMKEIGGEYFTQTTSLDKGLVADLVNQAKLVIWDQPGTGFLECLACDIPTLVLWDRLYCEEEDWTREDFQKLEDVKVIHRTSGTLLQSLQEFKQDPVRWTTDPDRLRAIDDFRNKYCLTSDKWNSIWKQFLKKLR